MGTIHSRKVEKVNLEQYSSKDLMHHSKRIRLAVFALNISFRCSVLPPSVFLNLFVFISVVPETFADQEFLARTLWFLWRDF